MNRIVFLIASALTAAVTPLAAQDLRFFRIATGSAAGTHFAVGAAVAAAISSPPGSPACDDGGPCGVPGLVAIAQSSDGSITNVLGVAQGRVDSGFAQADVIHWAYNGELTFTKRAPLDQLRVIANLYTETVHLVARRGAGIAAVKDLAGKRVSIDKPGSGTRLIADVITTAHGLRLNQVKAIEADPGQAIDMISRDELDAFFFVAGDPAAAITELAERGLIDLVPLGGKAAAAALKRHRFLAEETIPDGTYPGIGATPTLSIGAQWVVGANADPELIYQIVTALWLPRNRVLLDAGHARGERVRLETALSGISIPLHPGAERYYRETGLLDRRLSD